MTQINVHEWHKIQNIIFARHVTYMIGKMQDAKCETQYAISNMQNEKCRIENAKRKIQGDF